MNQQRSNETPRFVNWLVSRLIGDTMLEELEGDLQEMYDTRLEERGRRYARWMYLIDALHLIYGFSSINIFRSQNNTSMVKHNLKVVYRNLRREVSYSVINIAGLSIGIACCTILALYLKSELTYDQHFDKHDQIYRVVNQLNSGENSNLFAETSYALGPLLSSQSPHIESYVRFSMDNRGYTVFEYEDKSVRWDNIALADSSVFEVFSHEVILGNPETALIAPRTMAVSQRFAKTYFGTENPIGKTVKGELGDFKVTLVFADLPDNTHLKYDALITYQDLPINRSQPGDDQNSRWSLWYSRTDYTYVKMSADFDQSAFKSISDSFFDKYMADHPDRYESTVELFLEPLDQIHLYSEAQRDRPHGNRFYVAGFTGIAIFIMLVACINYMNLSTARLSKRTKSIAIPKILGAHRYQLIFQLLTESFVFILIALIIGLGLAYWLIHFTTLSALLNKTLSFAVLLSPVNIILIIVGVLVMSLIAGLYPAFILSRASMLKAVKSKDSRVRYGLVFVQFLVSICVISCTLLMYSQMKYVQNKSLGFEKENKLVMTVQSASSIERLPVLVNALEQNSNVISTTMSMNHLGRSTSFEQAEIENNEGVFVSHSYNWFYIDEDFINTMGIELLQGRNFDKTIPTDANHAILVNETLVRKMGWTDPIGKRLRYQAGEEASYVVGVMKDFHFQGLQHEVESMIFWLPAGDNFAGDYWNSITKRLVTRMLTVSITGDNIPETIAFIEEEYKKFDPNHPFDFQFLNDSLNKQYTADMNQMTLIGIFGGLCIFISCLGLFGLTTFTIEQRTKEIGIRKTLGASAWHIVTLIFRNIFGILIIAAIVGSIISYGVMTEWLEGFYYKENINLFVFVLAALASFITAFFTSSSQSWRRARANPVDALRSD